MLSEMHIESYYISLKMNIHTEITFKVFTEHESKAQTWFDFSHLEQNLRQELPHLSVVLIQLFVFGNKNASKL